MVIFRAFNRSGSFFISVSFCSLVKVPFEDRKMESIKFRIIKATVEFNRPCLYSSIIEVSIFRSVVTLNDL